MSNDEQTTERTVLDATVAEGLNDVLDDLVTMAKADMTTVDLEALTALADRISQAIKLLQAEQTWLRSILAHRIPRGQRQVSPSGMVYTTSHKPKRKGFKKPALIAKVKEIYGRVLIDPATGERVEALTYDAFELLDVATGRERKWRDAGVNLNDFADVDESPTLEVK